MIICPVCSHQNDEFAIKCTECGSYVQDRVPTLDFFSTLWLMVESPKKAFKKIILSEHKNYVLFLGLFLGIGAMFAMMWLKKSGNNFDNLFPALLIGTIAGLIQSFPLLFLLVFLLYVIAKALRGKGRYKETYAVTGWSLIPILFSVICILPLEFATLGLYVISSNPTAYEVNPLIASILLGIDGLLFLWSVILCIIGISMEHRFNYFASLLTVLAAVGLTGFISISFYSFFNI